MNNIIVSPVGGRVEAIDYIDNKTKIYIKVSLCSNFKAIAPQDSSMEVIKFQRGLNLDPFSYKAKLLNEQISLQFESCRVDFISGMCNKSINFIDNSTVYRTQKLGIFFHGLVVLSLDSSTKIDLKILQKIKAGDIICK